MVTGLAQFTPTNAAAPAALQWVCDRIHRRIDRARPRPRGRRRWSGRCRAPTRRTPKRASYADSVIHSSSREAADAIRGQVADIEEDRPGTFRDRRRRASAAVSAGPVVALSTSYGVPRRPRAPSIASNAASVPSAVMIRTRASTDRFGASCSSGVAAREAGGAPGAGVSGRIGVALHAPGSDLALQGDPGRASRVIRSPAATRRSEQGKRRRQSQKHFEECLCRPRACEQSSRHATGRD